MFNLVTQSDRFGTPPQTNDKKKQTSQDSNGSTASKEDEIDFYRSKVKTLESQMDNLQTECEAAHRKNKTLSLSESKVEQYIKENSSLHMDKDKADRQLKQKKTEADLWKQKYENFLQQFTQIKATNEQELQRINQQNQELQIVLQNSQYESQKQSLDIKAAYNDQLYDQNEDFKKHNKKQQDLSDTQLEKLRAHNDELTQNYDDLLSKMNRSKGDGEKEVSQLQQDNQKLQNTVNELENQRSNELNDFSHKLETYSESQIENLKNSYNNENKTLEGDNEQLRGLLEVKNFEVDTLKQQNNKMRVLNHEQQTQLRDELSLMKEAIIQQESQHRQQLENQLQELTDNHNKETTTLTQNFNSQIETLEQEYIDQKSLLDSKSEDFQTQINEKIQLRHFMEQEIDTLNKNHEDQAYQFQQFRQQKNQEIDEIQDQYQRANALNQQQYEQNIEQIVFQGSEIERMKELIKQGSLDAEHTHQQGRLQRKESEDQIKQLNKQVHDQKSENDDLERKRINNTEETKQQLKKQDTAHREKARQLENEIENLQIESKRLKEQSAYKNEEIDQIVQQKNGVEREIRKVRDEVEALKTNKVQQDRQKIQDMNDQQNKLLKKQQFEVNELKESFNTQTQVFKDENEDLMDQLERSKSQVEELIEMFKSQGSQLSKSQLLAYTKSQKKL